MKNLSISKKFFVWFSIIMFLMLVIVATGLFGIHALYYYILNHDAVLVLGYVNNITTTAVIILLTAFVVSIIAVVLIKVSISSQISKPLVTLDELLTLTSEGDIVFKEDELAELEKYVKNRDEVGHLFSSYAAIIKTLNEVRDELDEVAEGDLSFEVKARSESDLLTISLEKMMTSLNQIFGRLLEFADVISEKSSVSAQLANNLAISSAEHNVTIKNLSGSVTAITDKIRSDRESTTRAVSLAGEIMELAKAGSRHMSEMTEAVNAIEQSGQDISKIIKVINDIAFQTNILALNAAVEAARAGQHGKGFAVVADEVRNLAVKSADAAKDTDALISNSIEKSVLGARIAAKTAENLSEILTLIDENHLIAKEIYDSVDEQLDDLVAIDSDIRQVSGVIGEASTTADQAADFSEILRIQAKLARELISNFKLRE